MRWRLFLTFMAMTGAFCFILLTSVTDYAATGSPLPLIAGGQVSTRMLSSTMPSSPAPRESETASIRLLSPEKFDPQLRPAPARLFVPHDADPVWDRHETEKQLALAKRPRRQSKLKYSEDGWYREENALVTAYCPCAKCCGTQSPGITSIGKSAWTTGLAADPLKLEYGTKVLVDGYGLSVVDDTGGAMRRHWRRDGILHIDVRMTYHYEARQWGKRYMRLKIYESF
jgi:3D (Asp-Asp-Asp) domain-containing protein